MNSKCLSLQILIATDYVPMLLTLHFFLQSDKHHDFCEQTNMDMLSTVVENVILLSRFEDQ